MSLDSVLFGFCFVSVIYQFSSCVGFFLNVGNTWNSSSSLLLLLLQLNFTVSVDTSTKSIAKKRAEKEKLSAKDDVVEEDEEVVVFEEYPKNIL